MKETSPAIRRLQRLAALPFNPYFKKAVSEIRQCRKIPVGENGFKWFIDDIKANNYKKQSWLCYVDLSKYPFIRPAGETYVETDVPLEHDIWILIFRFGLPAVLFFNILMYILTNNEKWILLRHRAFEPSVKITSDFRRGVELKVVITRIGLLMNKEDWERIWDTKVKKFVDILINLDEEDRQSNANKRATYGFYLKLMKRWSEWYELHDLKGLGPAAIVSKWLEEHPYEQEKYDLNVMVYNLDKSRHNPRKYDRNLNESRESRDKKSKKYSNLDESTVTRAIAEFRAIVSPRDPE